MCWCWRARAGVEGVARGRAGPRLNWDSRVPVGKRPWRGRGFLRDEAMQ